MGPRWISLNLAALYWRVVGLVSEGVACARTALHHSPHKQRDVALVQLAQLVVRGGDRLDDGIALLRQALAVDADTPETHLLLGQYLLRRENLTGAAFHVHAALELDPRIPNAVDIYRALRCRLRQSSEIVVGQKMPDGSYTSQKMFVPPEPFPTPPPTRKPPPPKPKSPSTCALKKAAACPRYFCLRDGRGLEKCYLRESAKTHHCPGLGCQKPKCIRAPPTAFFLVAALGGRKQRERRGRRHQRICDGFAPMEADERRSERNESQEAAEVWLDQDNLKDGTSSADHARPPSAPTVTYPAPKKLAARVTIPPPSNVALDGLSRIAKAEGVASTNLPGPQLPELQARMPPESVVEGDGPLPEQLPEPWREQVRNGANLVHGLPRSELECLLLAKRVKLDEATSTYLSVTAKGVKLSHYVDFESPLPDGPALEPICPEPGPATMWSMEHLRAYQDRDSLQGYAPEKGLRDAFRSLGGSSAKEQRAKKGESVEGVGTRLALAMRHSPDKLAKENVVVVNGAQEAGVHWSLSTVAGLYWRVRGNASMAIRCLRHSVNNAPYHMRDLGLVSLANVYQQTGKLHSALVVASAALDLNHRFVVIHFTLGNIYATMGPKFYDRAMMFYFSTLALQNNFDPARDRVKALYCAQTHPPVQARDSEKYPSSHDNVPHGQKRALRSAGSNV